MRFYGLFNAHSKPEALEGVPRKEKWNTGCLLRKARGKRKKGRGVPFSFPPSCLAFFFSHFHSSYFEILVDDHSLKQLIFRDHKLMLTKIPVVNIQCARIVYAKLSYNTYYRSKLLKESDVNLVPELRIEHLITTCYKIILIFGGIQ